MSAASLACRTAARLAVVTIIKSRTLEAARLLDLDARLARIDGLEHAEP
jgi:hypothetical protein